MRRATLALIPALLLVAACDSSKKAPPPPTANGTAPTAGQLPSGHPPLNQLPPGHPPMGQMPGGEMAPSGPADGSPPQGCPLTWEMPGTWQPTRPANMMRLANFTVVEPRVAAIMLAAKVAGPWRNRRLPVAAGES